MERKIIEPDSPGAHELPYLSLENIESTSGRILLDDTCQTKEIVRSTTFRFDSRHVLYGKLRPYLNKVALPEFAGRCTTELVPLLPAPYVSRDFLAWLLRRPQTVAAAMKEKTGSRMPRANMQHLLSLPVMIPDQIAEQQRIANLMSSQLAHVLQAKQACQEQMALLDAYLKKALSVFPFPEEPQK